MFFWDFRHHHPYDQRGTTVTAVLMLLEDLWRDILAAESTRDYVIKMMNDSPGSRHEIQPTLDRANAEVARLRDLRNDWITAPNLTWRDL